MPGPTRGSRLDVHIVSMRISPTPSRGALGALLLVAAACATTGATFRSGVGDAYLESPPYYAGARVSGALRVVHLPIGYQRGASQSPIFDPAAGAGTPTAALLAEMNAYLDSLGVTTRVEAAGASRGTPPDARPLIGSRGPRPPPIARRRRRCW